MYQQQLTQNEQGNYTSSATKELDDLMASLSDFKVSPAEEETEHEWNNEKKKTKSHATLKQMISADARNHQIWCRPVGCVAWN